MMIKPLALSVCAALMAGCVANAAPDGAPVHTATSNAYGTACVAHGTWYDPRAHRTLDTDAVQARLKDKDVVLLGETHVFADHHRWQLQVMSQLYAQRPDMIIGFESFPRRVQGVLDRWVAGELSEEEFLAQSDWNTVWRYDPDLYMPMFHFARLNRIPMVALNVERSLTREVSQKGWRAIPEIRREGLSDPAPAQAGYLDILGGVFGRHGEGRDETARPGLDDPMFSGFVDVQLTWDRAMAEGAADALRKARAQGRDPLVVGIIGRGHLDHFYGVPAQLKDMGVDNVAVLTPWDRLRPCSDLVLDDGTPAADLVFGIENAYAEERADGPKLGVMIEGAEDGILIGQVLEDSIAAASGLQTGDVILSAAGTRIKQPGELVAIIQAVSPGTWLPLNVRRGDETMEIVARFPTTSEKED